MPPVRDDTIRLRDGRTLAYAEWGDAEGAPVLFFHGSPGSRLYHPDEEVTASSRVRLVTIDRPGIGMSDVLAERTYSDWPSDVTELADALGVEQFAVVGWSAGGPYAAACAARIPDRLTRVAIGASRALSQFNFVENAAAEGELTGDDRKLFELAQDDPAAAAAFAAEAYKEWTRTLWDNPDEWFTNLQLPQPDKAHLEEDPERRRAFIEAMREGVRQGSNAVAWEDIDAFLPWGFQLADIAIEVHVFHGEQDAWVERRHVDFLVATLPRARLTVWPDSGHGPERHWGEILQAVTRRS
jgi:pimeloyl-ACP methyl ester carboxylesterase